MNIKIGILSDTHHELQGAKRVIDLFVQNGCDYILHAGDIVEKQVLDYLKDSNITYVCVLGNNDNHLIKHMKDYNLFAEPYSLKIQDISIKIMHHPYYLFPQDSDITIYGHTHTQICEKTSSTLFLNSGEVCARNGNFSQAMILKVKTNKYVVCEYQRHIGSDEWNVSKKVFKNKGAEQ
ncbi:hypothetical protein MNB_ARC-1_1220 [hydrothermal vent metagenome]|uniref:Calcineurin-like phosphoesterase domain-containing protein n=1 Tax=hydrothermal vent metagenome TaxID=652676 RepID=A0A3B1DST6_9ZZZZ